VEKSGGEEPEYAQGSLEHDTDARLFDLTASEEMRYTEPVSTLLGTGPRRRRDGTFLWLDFALD
jgi:hypothetical protein